MQMEIEALMLELIKLLDKGVVTVTINGSIVADVNIITNKEM